MTRHDHIREQMLKEAAAGLTEAVSLLQEHEKAASAQAAGLDPTEYAKQAALARAYANLKYIDMADGLLEGMGKAAAEREKGEVPYSIDHPYMNQFMKGLPGMGIGGALGAVAGGVAGLATHNPEAALGGALMGGATGAALGSVPGALMAVKEHHDDALKLEREGYKMDFVTRHPYLTAYAGRALAGPVGDVAAMALHHSQKQDLADQIRKREA